MSAIFCLQFYVFSICVSIFTLFTYLVYYYDVITSAHHRDIQQEYDYIIVGSGTAGSLIAHRLATETNYSFVVLEAGSRGHTLLEAPVLAPFLHGSLYDWKFQTTPQEHACYGMTDRKCKLAQGMIVGGSSKLNNMIHIRGNISHYHQWFHGKYDEEFIQNQFDFIEKNIIHLSKVQYQSKLSEAILEAAQELGYINTGFNLDLGFMNIIVSQKNGKRWSTSDNLDISKHVISNVLVENVFFTGNIAKGVKYRLSNKVHTMNARKGVILCAGTINSPKILQLSGIGPEKLLNRLGIPVVKNLPVGRNLQDHVGTGLDFTLFSKPVSINVMDMINPYNVLEYLIRGKGPWTTPGCESVGLLSTKYSTKSDLLFMVLPVGISSDRGSLLRHNVNIDNKVWNNYFSKTFNSYAVTIMPIVSQPKSKGSVFINSTKATEPPLINPNYLSHEDDRKTLVEGLKLVIKLVNTTAIKNVGGYLNPLPFPGCEHFEIFTDSYFDCYIRHLTLTSYHPIGTCAMGLPGSKNSVVDTSFRVHEMENLYVADASVLPTMPSVNINAAVAMMASVFFETNIKIKNVNVNLNSSCYRYDFLYEFIYDMCFCK